MYKVDAFVGQGCTPFVCQEYTYSLFWSGVYSLCQSRSILTPFVGQGCTPFVSQGIIPFVVQGNTLFVSQGFTRVFGQGCTRFLGQGRTHFVCHAVRDVFLLLVK
jgi:hypothetical protein